MWQAGQQENKPVNRGSNPPAPSAPASRPARWLQGWRPGVCNYCPQTSSVSRTQEPHTTYGRWPSTALPSRKPTVRAGQGWQGRKGVAPLAGPGLCHPSFPQAARGSPTALPCASYPIATFWMKPLHYMGASHTHIPGGWAWVAPAPTSEKAHPPTSSCSSVPERRTQRQALQRAAVMSSDRPPRR